ncbi:MAG: DUF2437 domain-containing protein [Actinomycetaceae bacterium]|nr:DUF2437 domain-containing protein [Actinomycetaceae bacterium]
MRIARVSVDDKPLYGLVEDGAKRLIGLNGDPLFQQVQPSGHIVDLDEVRVLSPVIPRSKAVVVEAHTLAGDIADLEVTIVPNTAIVAAGDPVSRPEWASRLTIRPALAVVAKTLVRHVDEAAAGELVLGTCLASLYGVDGAAAALSHAWDASCPLGPWIEVADGHNPFEDGASLEIGEEVVEIEPMQVSAAQALSVVSQVSTLLPGDLVIVPAGQARLVADGDVVEFAHGRLGTISTRMMPPDSTLRS